MPAISGNLAAALPVAGEDFELYAAPPDRKSVGTLTFNNRARTISLISLAVTAGGAPRAEDWMFDEMAINGAPATVTGVVVGSGQKIFVRTTGLVAVNYNGLTLLDI